MLGFKDIANGNGIEGTSAAASNVIHCVWKEGGVDVEMVESEEVEILVAGVVVFLAFDAVLAVVVVCGVDVVVVVV